jgi:radical SAM protein with 4Fe4S-binding SPASM domain
MNKFVLKLRRLSRWDSWQRVPLKLRVRYINSARPRRLPNRIQIEATSKCNFRCACCSRAREKGGGQHLALEDFRKIMDWLPWRPERVILSGIGEPLMNPQFFPMVDVLAEKDIACTFYTNGSLLTPTLRQEILSRPNIDEISISCDGATANTFESLRVGADFEDWQRLVGGFLAEAKRQRPSDLRIGASAVINRQNLSEIGDIVRLTAKMGFDNLGILDPIPVDDVAASLCLSKEEFSNLRQGELCKLAEGLGLRIVLFLRHSPWLGKLIPRCMQPWEYMFIRANGNVAPCCAVFGSETGAVVGNVFRQTFPEIWHGDPFRAFRKSYASGKNALCRVCPYH